MADFKPWYRRGEQLRREVFNRWPLVERTIMRDFSGMPIGVLEVDMERTKREIELLKRQREVAGMTVLRV